MAHYKRGYPRTKTRGRRRYPSKWEWPALEKKGWFHMCSYPRYWDIQYHTRPQRAKTKAISRKVKKGADPENLAWPIAKKPHNYYW